MRGQVIGVGGDNGTIGYDIGNLKSNMPTVYKPPYTKIEYPPCTFYKNLEITNKIIKNGYVLAQKDTFMSYPYVDNSNNIYYWNFTGGKFYKRNASNNYATESVCDFTLPEPYKCPSMILNINKFFIYKNYIYFCYMGEGDSYHYNVYLLKFDLLNFSYLGSINLCTAYKDRYKENRMTFSIFIKNNFLYYMDVDFSTPILTKINLDTNVKTSIKTNMNWGRYVGYYNHIHFFIGTDFNIDKSKLFYVKEFDDNGNELNTYKFQGTSDNNTIIEEINNGYGSDNTKYINTIQVNDELVFIITYTNGFYDDIGYLFSMKKKKIIRKLSCGQYEYDNMYNRDYKYAVLNKFYCTNDGKVTIPFKM